MNNKKNKIVLLRVFVSRRFFKFIDYCAQMEWAAFSVLFLLLRAIASVDSVSGLVICFA